MLEGDGHTRKRELEDTANENQDESANSESNVSEGSTKAAKVVCIIILTFLNRIV